VYGPLTEPAVGIVLKEVVRRAITVIREHRTAFKVFAKPSYDDRADLVTSADLAANDIYVRLLQECFPGYGIVGEEADLRIPCTLDGMEAFFTVDPLDGTRAFARGQSTGIGTQIALTVNGQVVSAYVGDVCTQEIYGFRPGSSKVHRITDYHTAVDLTTIDRSRPLIEQYSLLRKPSDEYHPLITALVQPAKRGGATRKYEITSGSIGISMSRLWKGEVGLHVLGAFRENPWDINPLIGMAKQLDLVWLRPTANGTGLVPWQPQPHHDPYVREFDVVVTHRSCVTQLQQWCSQH
jgi:fructose-1,6-bisphosphatase/inositol monophosphatase family enzyme